MALKPFDKVFVGGPDIHPQMSFNNGVAITGWIDGTRSWLQFLKENGTGELCYFTMPP